MGARSLPPHFVCTDNPLSCSLTISQREDRIFFRWMNQRGTVLHEPGHPLRHRRILFGRLKTGAMSWR